MKPMKAKCAKCGDIVEVSHLREYKSCKCGAISLDYGDGHYSRMGGAPEDFDKEFDREQGIDRFKPFKESLEGTKASSNTDFYIAENQEKFYDTPYYGYRASKKGKIKGPSGKILTPQLNKNGYLIVSLSCFGKVIHKAVHRIIAETFIPNEDGEEQVNHLDGDKTNNVVENLEWCSREDNMKHAARVLGKTFGFQSRPVINLNTGEEFATMGEAAEKIQRSQSSLWEAISKGTRCNNNVWAYNDETDDMNELVERVLRWFEAKGLTDVLMQYVKMQEECGELAHELTRGHRKNLEIEDALGDILVTAIGLCHHLGYHPAHVLWDAYYEISKRKGKVIDGSFVKEKNG